MTGKSRKKSILVVEDEPDLAEIYQTLLEQAGYNVAVAHNGKEALDLAQANEPHVILLDLRMPVMDGVGFLEKFDLKKAHPNVKVIVSSNYDMQDEIDDA